MTQITGSYNVSKNGVIKSTMAVAKEIIKVAIDIQNKGHCVTAPLRTMKTDSHMTLVVHMSKSGPQYCNHVSMMSLPRV